jgi:hypothetical protein
MIRMLPVLALVSCNSYDLFNVSGFRQEAFSPKADILFVVDNSDSMQEEVSALATSFARFVATLGEDQADFPTEDLSDAVSFYAASVDSDGDFVNYQLAIVTTDGDEAGRFQGTGRLTRFDDAVDQTFASNLLCNATCFRETPANGNVDCGDPLGDDVTLQWLECECGTSWQDNCGPAQEEPLEAVFLAMCRSVPNPPAACFADDNDFSQADVMSGGAFLRPDATLIPVIVSDEGDDSRRLEPNSPDPEGYARLYAQFDQRMVWTYIGPDRNDDGEFRCGAVDWGANRIMNFVESTGGLYVPINDASTGCQSRDFDDTLAELGTLLKSLNRSFRLTSIPQEGTIAVYTSDGGAIREAELQGLSTAGVPQYGDGWSYDVATNTVLLHGDAIPEFDESVEVYYLPADGNPRDLPF